MFIRLLKYYENGLNFFSIHYMPKNNWPRGHEIVLFLYFQNPSFKLKMTAATKNNLTQKKSSKMYYKRRKK